MQEGEYKSIGIWIMLVLAGLGAVYLPGLHNEPLFDDYILTSGYVWDHYGSLLELKQRMLSYGSFVWLDALVGEGWWKQRLFNLTLHFAVMVALYSLFRMLLDRVAWSPEVADEAHFQGSREAALRVGLLIFALNPVAVYAVAYLIQRSILAATLFVVLACIAFVRGVLTGRPIWYVAAFASYVVALLCKEYALMAPALAIPLYVFLKRPGWRQVTLIVGGCVALVVLAVYALLSRYGEIIGVPFDELSRIYVEQLRQIDPEIEARAWPLSMVNQAALFFYYGFLWFVPNVLWMSIDMRPVFPVSFTSWAHLAGALGYVALLGSAAWLVLRRSDAAGFLGLCLLVPLLLFATEFSTVWIQDSFVLYRSYLWAIAIPGLVVLALVGLKPGTIYTIGLVVALVFGGLALERVMSLKSTLSVWSDAVEKIDLDAPENAVGRWRPYLNRGSYYLENAMPALAYSDFARAEALGELQGTASFNKGVSLQLTGNHEEALDVLALAAQRGFDDAGLYFHLAQSHMALGHFDRAFDNFTLVLEQSGDEAVVLHTRGLRAEVALRIRKYDIARDDFTLALEAAPDDYRIALGLAMAHVGLRDGSGALPHFDALIARQPHPSAFYGRALAYRLLGRRGDALVDLDRAIGLDPNNAVYRNLRAQLSRSS